VPAIVGKEYFSELIVLKNDQGARAIISREKSKTGFVHPEAELIDLDTPEIYEAQRRGSIAPNNILLRSIS
jgi:CTP:molybdopterin cytidylyltransferase MocA